MEPRPIIHERFVQHFAAKKLSQSPALSDAELDSIEVALNTKLPFAFWQFMTRFGPIYTPKILGLITSRGLDHPDIQEFLSVEKAVAGTKGYWSAGMPTDVIGVASDCMGNMIGFRRSDQRSDDLPVVFFDHDYVTVSELAPSFDECLSWYVRLAEEG
jgi:SMI1 / KNR4 family (SUKH-1)